MTLEPNRAEAERFLTALDPNANRWTFQTFDDSKERREERKARGEKTDPFAKIIHGTLKGHWRELVKLNAQGAGIFITVNLTDFKGRTAENIKYVRALFVDLDGSPLDPVIAEGILPPHIITETSPGRWHAYWRVESYLLDGVFKEEFAPLQKAIAARFNGDASINDLPRVMRLPGFIHAKGEPFLSRIERINSLPEYRRDAILAAFPVVVDDAGVVVEPEHEPGSAWTARPSKPKSSRWGELNERALKAESLPRWVPGIFPTATRTRHGGYRVASADLGRGFEEDLSIDPRGIKYFGIADQGDKREGRRTAVELVAEWEHIEAPQAAEWLEQALGGNGHDTESPPPPEPEPQTEAATDADIEITRLAKLKFDEYEGQRKAAAERLGFRASILDRLVNAERDKLSAKEPAPALYEHWNVETASAPVDGGVLLRALKEAIRRYVFVTDEQVVAATLWIVFSWLHEHSSVVTHSPILLVTSAEKDSGKTTLLGVLNFLTRRSLASVEISGPALFRSITKWQPTLIVDEADKAFVKNDDLRSVINSGWTRGQGVIRCHPETHEPELFSTFAPKIVGMKGRDLEDTTLSRSIIIEMRPKRANDPNESVADFDHLDNETFARLRSQLMRWTQDNADPLAKAAPEIPPGFHNRRRANWRTLLAVAEAGGGDWKKEGWKAALAIEAVAAMFDPSMGLQLLGAIKAAFEARGKDRITSAGLITDLTADETAPWATYNKGKPISQRQVANLLKAYGIKTKTIRFEDGSFPKGYLLEWFTDVFSRFYAPDGASPPSPSATSSTDLFSKDFSTSTSTSTTPHVEVRNPCDNNDVEDVADRNGGTGARAHDAPIPCAYCGRADGKVYRMNDLRHCNPVDAAGNPRHNPADPPTVPLHERCVQPFFAVDDEEIPF